MSALACLDDVEALALVEGTLATSRLPEATAHVDVCLPCQELIAGLCAESTTSDVAASGYRIDGVLATGGMGCVYRATELGIGREVALKVPRTQNRWLVHRFEREIAITARLGHPGVVALYGTGRLDDGRPFYAMQLVDGHTLERALDRATNREQRRALLPHLIAAATTMAFAHERGIAHRDLKPHNILVGRFGETVILDWGLAKDLSDPTPLHASPAQATAPRVIAGRTTRPGDVLGTPAFMAPEQARGEPVDQRSDVYALGAILEQLLVGRLPRKAANAALEQAPPELARICVRATAPEREARYRDAGELVVELRAALEVPPVIAPPARRWRWLGAVRSLLGRS